MGDSNDNITFRKRVARSVSTQNSPTMLNSSIMNSTALNDTIRSLPYVTDGDSSLILFLKQQIDELTCELQSAHQEINNLNEENSNLQIKVNSQTKNIEILKKLTTEYTNNRIIRMTPKSKHKSMTPTYRDIRHICMKTPRTSPLNYLRTLSPIKINLNDSLFREINEEGPSTPTIKKISAKFQPIIQPTQNKLENSETPHIDPLHNVSDFKKEARYETPTAKVYTSKRKVLILADQRGKHTRRILQGLLGNEYTVTSFWKPGATLGDILHSDNSEINNLNSNDYIIMLGGVNDYNPYEFKINLNTWLRKVTHTNVIIPEITYNKHLNENKLNYELRYACSMYSKNVSNIAVNYSNCIPHNSLLKQNLCQLIMWEIHNIKGKNNDLSRELPSFECEIGTRLVTTASQTDSHKHFVNACIQTEANAENCYSGINIDQAYPGIMKEVQEDHCSNNCSFNLGCTNTDQSSPQLVKDKPEYQGNNNSGLFRV